MWKEKLRSWIFLNHSRADLSEFDTRIALENLRFLLDYCILFVPLYLLTGILRLFQARGDVHSMIFVAIAAFLLGAAIPFVRCALRRGKTAWSKPLCTAFLVLLYASAIYYDTFVHPESISVMQCIALTGMNTMFNGYMHIILRADVNHDKKVDAEDWGAILNDPAYVKCGK